MTIYLYLKQHRITGLKYLGMTTKQDPYKYKGSGKLWKRHINKHGYDVDTSILLKTESYAEFIETAKFFSKLWNVVKSTEWANLTEESGEGGDTSDSEGWKIGMKKRKSMSGFDNPMHGRSIVKEKGLKWFNDGNINIYVNPIHVPKGFCPGRIILKRASHSDAAKIKMSRKKARSCIDPNGIIYPSVKNAASSHNVSTSAINLWIRLGDRGWKLYH